MKDIPHTFVVVSLVYAQTCTMSNISFAIDMFGRYQSNQELEHWKAAKKVLRYLQGTKNHIFTYKKSDHLYRFRLCQLHGYKNVYIWLCVSFSRRSDFMEKCEVICHCYINHRG